MRADIRLCMRNLHRLVKTQVRENWGLSHVNRFTFREFNCGDIDRSRVGKTVTLYGWLKHKRGSGKNFKFLALSDAYGIVQLLIKDVNIQLPGRGSVVKVTGRVEKRPAKDVNPDMKSGEVEVHVEDFQVLGASENVGSTDWIHDDRLLKQYRYVELRSEKIQRNLRLKSQLLMSIRNYLCQEGFVEIETPVLQKITPGGAHEFVVPTTYENEYYCLAQSPQIYKQLCMIGAVDRYFQIAKCFRNETGRADRQPEFLQIDMEMSFTSREGIIDLIENLLLAAWPMFLEKISIPFPRMRFDQVMCLYGSDKPDLRSDIELKELVGNFNGRDEPYTSLSVPLGTEENYAKDLTKSIQEEISRNQFEGHVIIGRKINGSITLDDQSLNPLSSTELDSIRNGLSLDDIDYLLIATGSETRRRKLMGILRNLTIDFMVNHRLIDLEKEGKHPFNFLWVIDCPMFSINEINGQLECNHHPFTAPRPDQFDQVYSDPLNVTSDQFDLVLNGIEIGGGSMRITCPKLQEYIFKEVLKQDPSPMDFFFKALASGCPPHGGLAIGVDRLLRILLRTDTIRDFIPFPKTTNCRDNLSFAPTAIPGSLKKLYHIK